MKTSLRLAVAAASVAALGTTALGSAVAATPSVPVYRISGADRVATAVEASKATWDDAGTPNGPTATAVVISRDNDYADALGGSALAGVAGGPLLLTHTGYLDKATLDEVNRVLGGTGTVYLLGGTGAISSNAANSLKGYTVKRLAGVDRYETSVAVAKEVALRAPGGHPQFIFATTGENFPDGLAAGATAAGYSASVVLTKNDVWPAPVKTYLTAERGAGVATFAVGGATPPDTATFSWTDRFAGKDRYETAALIADAFWGDPSSAHDDATGVALATGENWPDALAGGALIATAGPLLLAKPTSLPAPTKAVATTLVKSSSPSTIQVGFVLGGTGAVNDAVKAAFGTALNS